ncbi:MAG: hypothetical protein BM557_04880 [Flavobacterium sp. MedPE-SWcel]|uniref:MerR family transcriptional regulator n=1 Tax=uncultured Flavobacterium sp. TaxID=165435 RepID=UPI00091D6F9F|nr:MerR family transcriptional regulator [uncultured Flavobacterium sp.]OIQ21093.1 MAG: hypothetical protein BM557_04880 [Flavobacterium sp. MedPE-SWcel]
MMVKSTFQIKDLENLTGVKIPTLRIWEKRYNILKPARTNTGIRSYNIEEVLRLLNIAYLNRNGWKISKIAALTEKEIQLAVKNIDQSNNDYPIEVEEFLIAMLSLDQVKFSQIYSNLRNEYSFETIFENYFHPLLFRIGILWQTETIDIIHEHFISSLIIQKLIFEIENIKTNTSKKSKTHILFLPLNEIHEIGLRYLQYQLLLNKKDVIYLGNNVDLIHLNRFKDRKDIVIIGSLTIVPNEKSLNDYLKSLNEFATHTNLPVHLYGLQFNINSVSYKKYSNINIYQNAKELLKSIK